LQPSSFAALRWIGKGWRRFIYQESTCCMGVLYCIKPPHMVAIQLKILIPVGAQKPVTKYIYFLSIMKLHIINIMNESPYNNIQVTAFDFFFEQQ
jgi:hypothetical protein